MDSLNSSNPRTKKSPSPARTQVEYQPSIKKSVMLNESEIDSNMKHWEEFRVKGIKIHRRSYHSAATHGHSLYIYGGYEVNAGNLEDFVKVDLDQNRASFEWEEVPVNSHVKPGPRSRHSTVVYHDKMYLYGGQTNAVTNTNKLMAFDFTKNEWSIVEPKSNHSLPSIDSHVALLWNQGEDKTSMIIVGGFISGENGGYSNGVFEYDFKENECRVLFKNKEVEIVEDKDPIIPQGRTGLGAAIHRNTLYVFGGNEGNTKLNDLWKFDLIDKKWTLIKTEGNILPEPRNGHSMICFKDLLIIFGGILDVAHEKNDVFIFDLQKSKWLVVEKDTKWVFENDTQRSPSPKKYDEGRGLDESGSRSKSPHRKLSPRGKIAPLKNDISMDSQDVSLTNPAKDRSLQMAQSPGRSPNKYTKLKLLESLPKGGHLAPAFSAGDEETMSPNSKQQSSLKSSLEEKHQRDKLLKKMMLLKEFEVEDERAKEDLTIITPALEAMQKSIRGLGINDKSKDKTENMLSTTMAGLASIRANADKATDDGNPIKPGIKPVARDGHSATIIGERMFIFGGDRHKMSFNDLFALNLKFLNSLHF